ncbi:hypothetical protein GCM10023347_41980 [Streptomyces chumphonensis]|uniref:Uncharacterized protein n=1 Tax=Streptomyces chumphonensis TaxID=1214925 RepID=A0A927EX04_9ACTN|nr:hypothetical protein [Streptomyces chumphonensis]MBD3930292.1 hypothetical protein [Streptomyces chumphonensis]
MTEREQGPGEGREPLDEDAAWAQIVAGYGAEPPDPPGVWARAEAKDGSERSADTPGPAAGEGGDAADPGEARSTGDGGDSGQAGAAAQDAPDGTADDTAGTGRAGGSARGDLPERSITVYSAGNGPRDWVAPEREEDDHFVPPEPPPLPPADTTTKFAWLAVLGGPALLLAAVLFGWDMTWWMSMLGIGGFLGGFGTLVMRMRDGREDDDWDDPGRGAVV